MRYTHNQPFAETLKEIIARSELLFSELLDKCNNEKTYEFEYYWEIWGVMWYPWTIEINGKFQTFTYNDISENDLIELIQLKKIELIKIFDKSEMTDEFDRKRYKIINDS